jgi:DNA invertase Pin-like site-specific DNA recombinase
LLEGGRIAKDNYLIVENLDRLTREDVVPATHLLTGILIAGVRVVQLKPRELVLTDKSPMPDIMYAVMELSRGNSESKMKSERVGAAWRRKKIAARDGTVLTSVLPPWVRNVNGKLVLIPKATATVKRIFQLATAGYGVRTIVKKLKEDGVPPIGRTGRWSYGYVASLFVKRLVLGEYQPKKNKQTEKDGDVIRDYYPAVITEEEWLLARAAIEQRKKYKGRIGGERINIFAGILKHALDGDNYIMTQQMVRMTRNKKVINNGLRQILINRASEDGTAKQRSLPYDGFETAILSQLREIDPHEILNGDHPHDETVVLAAELGAIESELAEATAWMDANGFSAAIAKRIADLETRKAGKGEELAQARMEAAHPLSESWGEAQSLIDALASASDQRDARLRLRSALRRIVDSIWLLIVPHRADRLAYVQVWFAGGKKCRSYLLMYRPGAPHRQPSWFVHSWKQGPEDGIDMTGVPDLRNPADAAKIERSILKWPESEWELYAIASDPEHETMVKKAIGTEPTLP